MKPGKKNWPSSHATTSTSSGRQPRRATSLAPADLTSPEPLSMATMVPCRPTATAASCIKSSSWAVRLCTKVPRRSRCLPGGAARRDSTMAGRGAGCETGAVCAGWCWDSAAAAMTRASRFAGGSGTNDGWRHAFEGEEPLSPLTARPGAGAAGCGLCNTGRLSHPSSRRGADETDGMDGMEGVDGAAGRWMMHGCHRRGGEGESESGRGPRGARAAARPGRLRTL